jgi:hypothetical protein
MNLSNAISAAELRKENPTGGLIQKICKRPVTSLIVILYDARSLETISKTAVEVHSAGVDSKVLGSRSTDGEGIAGFELKEGEFEVQVKVAENSKYSAPDPKTETGKIKVTLKQNQKLIKAIPLAYSESAKTVPTIKLQWKGDHAGVSDVQVYFKEVPDVTIFSKTDAAGIAKINDQSFPIQGNQNYTIDILPTDHRLKLFQLEKEYQIGKEGILFKTGQQEVNFFVTKNSWFKYKVVEKSNPGSCIKDLSMSFKVPDQIENKNEISDDAIKQVDFVMQASTKISISEIKATNDDYIFELDSVGEE